MAKSPSVKYADSVAEMDVIIETFESKNIENLWPGPSGPISPDSSCCTNCKIFRTQTALPSLPDVATPHSDAESIQRIQNLKFSNPASPTIPLWSDLPDDILRRILDQLPHYSRRVVRLVCRNWLASTSRTVNYLCPEQFQTTNLPHRFPNISILDLSVADSTLELNQSSGNLAMISKINDHSLSQFTLGSFIHLKDLFLRKCPLLEGPGLRHLANLPQLTRVDLSSCTGLTDHGLAAGLQGLGRVRDLTLLECTGLTDAGVSCLVALPQLETLSIPPATTDIGLRALASSPSLQRIALRKCSRITPQGISVLLSSLKLKRVVVSRCPLVTAMSLQGFAPKLSVVHCTTKMVDTSSIVHDGQVENTTTNNNNNNTNNNTTTNNSINTNNNNNVRSSVHTTTTINIASTNTNSTHTLVYHPTTIGITSDIQVLISALHH